MITTIITIYWFIVIIGVRYGYIKFKDDVDRYPLNIIWVLLFSLLLFTSMTCFNDSFKDLYYYIKYKFVTWKSLRKIKDYEDDPDNIGI